MARNLERGKKAYIAYIVCLMVILLLPLVGMAFTDSSKALADSEKRDLASMPSLKNEEGGINEQYLSDLGAYFEDHFAFRDRLITADGLIKRAFVGSSPGDEVIMGKDGWLYYKGTLRDYLGRENMSARELYDLAHNMRLIQDYATQDGARFAFVIAANKNTLYPEHMPDNLVKGGSRNADNLKPYLETAGVNHVDMADVLAGEEGLYFERDTHWNGKGAMIGYNAIMDALGREHETFEDIPFEERVDHQGDLDEMAFPSAWTPEVNWYAENDFGVTQVGTDGDVGRKWITATCPTGQGTLVMYRDSFGIGLIPFMSQAFTDANYTQLKPYDMAKSRELGATDVVVEIAERNLVDLISRPTVFPSPGAAAVEDFQERSGSADPEATRLQATVDGSYLMVSGTLDPALVPDMADLVVEVNGEAYTPFYTSNAGRTGTSFYVCIPHGGGNTAQVRVFVLDGQEAVLACQENIGIE